MSRKHRSHVLDTAPPGVQPGPRGPRTGWATVRYAATWILAAAAVAFATGLFLRTDTLEPADDPLELELAAREAGCTLRRDSGPQDHDAVRVQQPPTYGPAGDALAAGIYDAPLLSSRLVASLREGLIVVQYRPNIGAPSIRRLRRELGDRRPPTIVVPDGTGMRFALAVTAWTRLLGCPMVDEETIDVAQAFRQRYAGAGPDAP